MLVSHCHRARTFINPSLNGEIKYLCKRCLQPCHLIDTNIQEMDIMENFNPLDIINKEANDARNHRYTQDKAKVDSINP